MNNKQLLAALSMDLKRIALGLHRGSYAMASRFSEEADKRMSEVEKTTLLPYMEETLDKIHKTLKSNDINKKAEDILMYSTIVQNYTVHI